MYHSIYPQMVITLNPQEAGIPGQTAAIPLYDGVQYLPLPSQDNDNYINNSINMVGGTVGSSQPYSQNMVFNQGNILSNKQQTNNVLAMTNSAKLISLENNHGRANVVNNRYNHDQVLAQFNQVPQHMHHNYNGAGKQYGNAQKDRKYGGYNNQNTYGHNNKHNNQNNYKRQDMPVYNNDRPQQNNNKNERRNGAQRADVQNQNNNYQNHNRNHYNPSAKKNWGWQNKQRNGPKGGQNMNVDCSSSASSSSSVSPPMPVEIKHTPNKKGAQFVRDSVNTPQNNTQITPRKSPTLGEFMLKSIVNKDCRVKNCSRSLCVKHSNTVASMIKENASVVGSNNSLYAESWPEHYGFVDQQFHNKSYRMSHQVESKYHQSFPHQHKNGYGHGYGYGHKRRDNNDSNTRDHRFGACYQRTRRYHLAVAGKDVSPDAEKEKPVGHSVPYSMHNLVLLYIYYNLQPCESLPFRPQNFFVPADRFLIKAHDNTSSNESWFDVDVSNLDKLSQAVWQKYLSVRQTHNTYLNKLMLWKYLFLFIKNFYPRHSLFLVGSTMTGFASNNSDVDFCLIVKHTEIDQRNEAQLYLEELFGRISHYASEYFEDIRLFPAKVPILRFHDCIQKLDVDLNCNNFVGIRNTHLLHCYNQMDWRVRPLVLTVKQWARCNQMNSARESTISSYSLTLMVIHYLQCGVTPPILPCLHAMFPEKFDGYNDIHTIDINEILDPYKTDNKQSLGDLMLGFFDYYSKFDYANYAISVRLAKLIKIETCKHEPMPKNDPGQWGHICIEEPFDRTNTARSVYLYNMFLYIKSVFELSHAKLAQTRDLQTIMDLGLPIPDQCPSPPPKGPSGVRPEMNLNKSKWRNGYSVDGDVSRKKIETAG